MPNNEEGRAGRIDFIRFIIGHELGHFLSVSYDSEELQELVYGQIFRQAIENKLFQPGYVEGAEIKAIVDGRMIAVLQNLDEAEVVLINQFVVNNRGERKIVIPVSPEELGVKDEYELLLDLLAKLNPDLKQSIRILAELRSQNGGREKLCRLVGQKFNAKEENQLLFGLAVLLAIDFKDIQSYEKNCGKIN